jgi:hypothetical protein
VSVNVTTNSMLHHPSIAAAVTSLGLRGSNPADAVRGACRKKCTSHGFHWRYAKDFVSVEQILIDTELAATVSSFRRGCAPINGMKMSTETRSRMSASHPKKPVLALVLGTEAVESYESTRDPKLVKQGFASADIVACCKGRRVSAYGRVWLYAPDQG